MRAFNLFQFVSKLKQCSVLCPCGQCDICISVGRSISFHFYHIRFHFVLNVIEITFTKLIVTIFRFEWYRIWFSWGPFYGSNSSLTVQMHVHFPFIIIHLVSTKVSTVHSTVCTHSFLYLFVVQPYLNVSGLRSGREQSSQNVSHSYLNVHSFSVQQISTCEKRGY